MSNYSQFTAIKSNESIDTEKGVIHGVSVITEGQAQGANAGTWIDKTTLSQIHSVALKFPDGIKVKLSQSKEHDGSAGQIVGVLKQFRIDGKQVRADLHLLKADENFSKIMEMSATMPSEFGLSVVIPKELEKIDGKDCLRCSDIYSIDIVSAPAANPSGLFSKTPKLQELSIKYKYGDSGDHADDCECKECMAKAEKKLSAKNKTMSALFAKALGLSAEATDDQIADGLKAALAAKQTDVAALSAKLSKLEADGVNAVALSQKAEIDNLLVEAARDGKVVPFDNEDLYASVDGKVSIKMLPTQLSKVISKLPKGAVKTSRTVTEAPKGADGKPLVKVEDRIEFCRQKQAEGAVQLTEMIRKQRSTFN